MGDLPFFVCGLKSPSFVDPLILPPRNGSGPWSCAGRDFTGVSEMDLSGRTSSRTSGHNDRRIDDAPNGLSPAFLPFPILLSQEGVCPPNTLAIVGTKGFVRDRYGTL